MISYNINSLIRIIFNQLLLTCFNCRPLLITWLLSLVLQLRGVIFGWSFHQDIVPGLLHKYFALDLGLVFFVFMILGEFEVGCAKSVEVYFTTGLDRFVVFEDFVLLFARKSDVITIESWER